MMDQQFDLPAYIDMARRRKRQMLIPAAGVFLCTVLLVLLLPSIYMSSATILIENQNIAKEVLQTTVSGYVEQRLQTLSQVVLGRVKLMELIKKLQLYEDYTDKLTDEELIEKMRKNIKLEPVQADVTNPSAPRNTTATIAFDISFEDRDPKKAASVTSELASLFLEANLKSREDTATSAVDFLEKQTEELRKEMEEKELKLSIFKETNLKTLPELTQLNLSNLDRMERDRSSLEEQARSLQSRKVYLEGQLALQDPYSGSVGPDGARYLSPKEEHERLRRAYMSMRGSLSEQHPDVVKVKRQLDAVSRVVQGPTDIKIYADTIREKQQKLTKLQDSATDSHPDVIALKREISTLQREMTQAQATPMPPRALDEPTNPAYIALQAQAHSTALELRGVQAQLGRLSGMQMDMQRRLEGTPKVEQEYQGMLRDLESSKLKFRELSARLMAAKESKGLEESQIGDKFTLIAPPLVPEKPVKPKRLLILALGMVLSVAAGIGTGVLLESMDSSIKKPETIAMLTEVPILAVIPYMVPPKAEAELSGGKKWRPGRKLIIIGAGAVLLLAVHILYDPLDVIIVSVFRKVFTLF